MIKKILLPLFILSFFCGSTVLASEFNGIISFRKISGIDTTYYKYYVSENKIRVEDIKKNGVVNGAMVIDLINAKVVLLSDEKKIFKDFPSSTIQFPDLNLNIEKTKNKMKVASQNCYQYIVTNTSSGAYFEFWVSKKNYVFFNRMLTVLNRKESIAQTWLGVEFNDNMFPMIGIQYDIDGNVVTKIEVTNVESKKLPEGLFEVPSDYRMIEKL